MAGVIVYEDAMIEIRDEGCGQLSILCTRPLKAATPYTPFDQWETIARHLAWVFINERRRLQTIESEDTREALARLRDLAKDATDAAFSVHDVLRAMSILWGELSR